MRDAAPVFTPDELRSEEWKPVAYPFPGPYAVSSLGRICRLTGTTNTQAGRLLNFAINQGGYPVASICFERKYRTVPVHHIVMATFVGPRPPQMEINHIDGDKRNARLSNLEYCTGAQNAAHASRTGLLRCGDDHHSRRMPERVARGERAGRAKLTENDISTILSLLALPISLKEIGARFGVSKGAIREIMRGGTWAHIPRDNITRPRIKPLTKRCVLRESEVEEIRKLAATGTPRKEIAARFSVSVWVITDIVLRRTWTEVA